MFLFKFILFVFRFFFKSFLFAVDDCYEPPSSRKRVECECLVGKSHEPTTAHNSNNNLEILASAWTHELRCCQTRSHTPCSSRSRTGKKIRVLSSGPAWVAYVYTNVPAAAIWQRDPSVLQRLDESTGKHIASTTPEISTCCNSWTFLEHNFT